MFLDIPGLWNQTVPSGLSTVEVELSFSCHHDSTQSDLETCSAQTSFSTCGLLSQGCLGPTALKEVGPTGSQSPRASGISSTAVAMAYGRKEIM